MKDHYFRSEISCPPRAQLSRGMSWNTMLVDSAVVPSVLTIASVIAFAASRLTSVVRPARSWTVTCGIEKPFRVVNDLVVKPDPRR